MNQAIFTKILVTEDGVVGAILAQPFADLWTEEFAETLQNAASELRSLEKKQLPETFV